MNATLSHSEHHAHSKFRADDEVVLSSMPLRKDAEPNKLSRFADDCWDIRPAILQKRLANVGSVLDFTIFESGAERLMAKEYMFALLNERQLGQRSRLHPNSARPALRYLSHFTSFAREQLGGFAIKAVDQQLLDAYRSSLAAVSSGQWSRYLRPVVMLHRLAAYLTCGGLTFAPWGGRTLYQLSNRPLHPRENLTPRIPESVIGALVRWSIKYIDVFAADIFAAREQMAAQEAALPKKQGVTDVAERLANWIDERRRLGRGVPIWRKPLQRNGLGTRLAKEANLKDQIINVQIIALQSGVLVRDMYQHRAAIAYPLLCAAINELGIEQGGIDTKISIDPDTGTPWRNRFDQDSLIVEEKNLQAAAYIICAYFTGMRDGEIQAMEPGCLRNSLSADGMLRRLSVRSTLFKGRDVRGEQAEWITIEPVDRAVAVAERLADLHRRGRYEDEIWFMLDRRSSAPHMGIPDVAHRLNQFRENVTLLATDGADIPLIDGEPWRFTTRQFRRTLAWFIANRPFGVVAGKIQYKHASVAMFDGYAGSSASGFLQEIEQERALGQLDDVIEQFEAHRRGERVAGPAALRLDAEFSRADAQVSALPAMVADKARLRAMLGHLARTLHVGYLNDCFFEPSTALCLSNSALDERTGPRLSQCAPDRCPNSCITSRHLPIWQASIAEADELLKDKRLPILQREVLQRDNERKRKLIAPLRTGSHT